jgi:hypothetical protein
MEGRNMAEAKPLASLSSGLLARKGQASPAMRRQGMISLVPEPQDGPQDHLEDLGWNDMGDAADHVSQPSGLSPMAAAHPVVHAMPHAAPVAIAPAPMPEVVRQQQELARDIAEPVRQASERAAPGSRGKAAFTLRLDAERHLKLRLVCAVNHRSAQQIVTKALDEFLAAHPITAELDAAKNASGRSST